MKNPAPSREELRQKGIELYKMNWKVSAICSTLGCSRGWLYKWLNRYNENDETWFKDEPRVPHNIPNKIDPEMEQMIVQTRKELMASPYSQYGPQAIYFSMAQKGYPQFDTARYQEDKYSVNPIFYIVTVRKHWTQEFGCCNLIYAFRSTSRCGCSTAAGSGRRFSPFIFICSDFH